MVVLNVETASAFDAPAAISLEDCLTNLTRNVLAAGLWVGVHSQQAVRPFEFALLAALNIANQRQHIVRGDEPKRLA